MKVGVLTSSRSDYGIYSTLLKALKNDIFFEVVIIAFGTHLSRRHGLTIKNIYDDGFYDQIIKVNTVPKGDSPQLISEAMGKTITAFAHIWENNKFDIVLCLGDRYEMFAACASSVPFNVKLAHISGGEQTIGAIDDAFRHSMTHMSTFHFTTSQKYKQRVIQLKADYRCVYNTGALNIDNIISMPIMSKEQFKKRFGIDLNIPSILITFHPETISYENNISYVNELIAALERVNSYQLIITMPNADTDGDIIRKCLKKFISSKKNAIEVESFGALGYLSCVKWCSFMLGNTSSGFVEAAYFMKYVINLGNRQNGRILTKNIRSCTIEKNEIIRAINEFPKFSLLKPITIYGRGNASNKIINILKTEF